MRTLGDISRVYKLNWDKSLVLSDRSLLADICECEDRAQLNYFQWKVSRIWLLENLEWAYQEELLYSVLES